MFTALKNHWREYLIEAWCLCVFMISACSFGVILFHPDSILAGLNWIIRNTLMGLIMGATAIAIIISPWGKRSGAHFNPALTLTFYRLRKIKSWDAVFYIAAHFAGGFTGVLLAWLVWGNLLGQNEVNFVVTVPGRYGTTMALIAEIVISFSMMLMVLASTNSPRFSKFTPYFAGILVWIFISVESPVSGMSMNPARSFASALASNTWTAWWIYFIAPVLAMLAAAEIFVRVKGVKEVYCAKLQHDNSKKCIFNCRYAELAANEKIIEVTKEKHLFPTITGLF